MTTYRGGVTPQAGSRKRADADDILITDTDGFFDSTNVEDALSEINHKTVANKAAAVLITPVANTTLFVGGTDGGLFKAVTGAAPSTYSDNGGSYCGTQFIPTGGDGSSAWVRVDGGYNVGLGHQPEWYGATGNDSARDTTGIQTILTNGNDVVLSPVTYLVTGLTFAASLSIIGSGQSSIIKLASGTSDSVLKSSASCSDLTFSNFKIDGSIATSTGGTGLALLHTHSNVVIDKLWIIDCYNNGIWAGGGTNGYIRITDCLCSGAFNDDGILIHTASQFLISGCIVSNSVTNSQNNCISVYHSVGASGEGSISNCVTYGGENGITIEGESSYCAISNCYSNAAGKYAFSVQATSTDVVISNSIGRGAGVAGFYLNGSVGALDRVQVSNCQARGNLYGLYAHTVTDLIVTGLFTSDNTTDTTATGASLHLHNCTNALISKVISKDTKTNGVYISSAAGVFISDSYFTGSTNAIRAASGSDIVCEGNRFGSVTFPIFDGSNLVVKRGNYGDDETVTAGSPFLRLYGISSLNSSGGAITGTLGDGNFIGQQKNIVMIDATTSSTVSVSNHETSNPEVFTFANVDDTLVLMWQGAQWITIANSGVTV